MDAENTIEGTVLQALLPPELNLKLVDCQFKAGEFTIHISSTLSKAVCPGCGSASGQIYGHYIRRLWDLPFGGTPVCYVVRVRKLAFTNGECQKAVCCESLTDLTLPHARWIHSLIDSQRAIGNALGGEAGSRLAGKLGLPGSADTLLRRVRSLPDESLEPPRFGGIDDWAFKKGQKYGTIRIDLERRRIIDIFPDRDGEALRAWLIANPQVEVITRDRWAAYAEASTAGAPQAKQVADRWRLLKNLREDVERILALFVPEIRAAGDFSQPAVETDSADDAKLPIGQSMERPMEPSPDEVHQTGTQSNLSTAELSSPSSPNPNFQTTATKAEPGSEREQARQAK